MIAEQYERAKQILSDKTEGHKQLSQILLEKEIIYAEDLEHVFGKRQWISRAQEHSIAIRSQVIKQMRPQSRKFPLQRRRLLNKARILQ